jgi:uncharacterized BrkB/YihY/UPF0761 family membrane protein
VPADDPADHPADRPADRPADQPAGQPGDQPDDRPGVRERFTATAERMLERAQGLRRRSDTVDAAYATHERDQRVVGSVLAGAIAFRLFVYLLPLFLAVVTTLGILVGIKQDSPEEVGEELGLSRSIIASVTTASRDSHRSIWILVPLTLWAIYTGGLGAAKVLHAVHRVAWDRPVERLQKGWLASLVTFGIALVGGGAVAGLQALRHRSERVGIGFAAAEILVLVVVWLVAARLLPHHPDAGWRALLPGAVLVGVGSWLLHLVSAYFLVHRITNASELYGSLGVAAALLAWLFILGRLMVASAVLNATLWERRR